MIKRIKLIFTLIFIIFLFSCGNREILSYFRIYEFPDFDTLNSPVNKSDNEYLILGNRPVNKPTKNIPENLATLIGRWEGYDISLPVTKDIKTVLFIQEITKKYIKGYYWAATNLQFPNEFYEFRADIVNKNPYKFAIKSISLDIKSILTGGYVTFPCDLIFTYDKKNEKFYGELKPSGEYNTFQNGIKKREIILTREKNFVIYKDYDKYLAGKQIYVKEYQDNNLKNFGKGYMIYLPVGYKESKNKKWPLIVFLHGTGDRSENIQLLAKASPYMYIREHNDLPFIIAAPILRNSYERSFPDSYMDNFLTRIINDYRVDANSVYFTGLSMGGEAVYRYAINHPDRVAAISPLCPPLLIDMNDPDLKNQGWKFIDKPLTNLKDMPIWTIGGGKDLYVPEEHVRKVVNAIKESGGNIKLTILEENDHDVWTDTYSDPAFYDWFLQHRNNF